MGETITLTIEYPTKRVLQKEYKKGTTLYEIAKELQPEFKKDIILAFVNQKLQELHIELQNDCEVRFVTVEEAVAWKAYVRGIKFMMLKAMYANIPRGELRDRRKCRDYGRTLRKSRTDHERICKRRPGISQIFYFHFRSQSII